LLLCACAYKTQDFPFNLEPLLLERELRLPKGPRRKQATIGLVMSQLLESLQAAHSTGASEQAAGLGVCHVKAGVCSGEATFRSSAYMYYIYMKRTPQVLVKRLLALVCVMLKLACVVARQPSEALHIFIYI